MSCTKLNPKSEIGGTIDLTVIVPTRNEAGNIAPLVRRLSTALRGRRAEFIFVDDSDDDTEAEVDRLGEPGDEHDVLCLHRDPDSRVGGLGGAVVAGLKAALGEYVCVMDGDLQHPPELVPELLSRACESDHPNLVVASRYSANGASRLRGGRSAVSRASTLLAKSAFPRALRDLSDPMSGFFLFRREDVDASSLRPDGFKILMEIAVRTTRIRVAEVGFTFQDRSWGSSKASLAEGARFASHVVKLRRSSRRAVEPTQCYNIHGIITVESDARLPELEAFRVGHLDAEPTIRVHLAAVSRSPHVLAQQNPLRRYFHFSESPVASPLLRFSPHVLYTNLVEPLLRWSFVERGYALTHAAVVVTRDNSAFLITARTDTGKTTTMLKLLDAHPYRFIADDLCILSSDGTVRAYPKPLTISQHTLHAVKRARLDWHERLKLPLQSRLHSREGRKFAFWLAKSGLPVATVNTLTQLVVPPPKYAVARLIPGVEIAQRGRVEGMFIIQRGPKSLRLLGEQEALDILLMNCEDAYGFPPYHKIEDFVMDSSGEDLRAIERRIIASALAKRPAALLSSDSLDWAERIPPLIADFGATSEDRIDLVLEEWSERGEALMPGAVSSSPSIAQVGEGS
jgi:glycosyltransferase involved in cell wall biosynthesis